MESLRGRLLLAACLAVTVVHPAQGQRIRRFFRNGVIYTEAYYGSSQQYGVYGGSGLQPPAQAQMDVRQFVGHQTVVRAVAFTPNNKFLVTAGYDENIRVWGLASGMELRRLEGHKNFIDSVTVLAGGGRMFTHQGRSQTPAGPSVAVFPDGKRVVSGGFDKTVRLWDLASGTELRRFSGHDGEVHHVAISPDGRFVASASADGTVRLWGVSSGTELRRLGGHQGPVYAVAFSPDGKVLASAGQDHTLRLWDAAGGKEVRQLAGHTDSVFSVAFSPDGRTLASASHDHTVRLWDVDTGKERQQLNPYPERGGSNSDLIFSGVETKVPLIAYRGNGGSNWSAQAVAFSPDGRTLASAGTDHVLRLWEVATGKECAQFWGHNGTIGCVAFSPDGRTLASASDDQTARLWDATCQRRMPPGSLSARRLDGLWNDLGDQDATKAYRAVWALAGSAGQAVPLFRERLLSHGKGGSADPRRVARLIAELDDDQFAVREKATDELEKIGKAAGPALRRALQGRHSAEVAFRVKLLLDHLKGSIWTPDALRQLRAVAVLEHIASPQAREVLQALAGEAAESGLGQEAKAALERLTRRPAAS